MSYHISFFIMLKICLPIVISLLIINLIIVLGNFSISKIFSSLDVSRITQIQCQPAVFFDEVLTGNNPDLIDKLLPNNIHHNMTDSVWIAYFFSIEFQSFQISHLFLQFRVQLTFKVIKVNGIAI